MCEWVWVGECVLSSQSIEVLPALSPNCCTMHMLSVTSCYKFTHPSFCVQHGYAHENRIMIHITPINQHVLSSFHTLHETRGSPQPLTMVAYRHMGVDLDRHAIRTPLQWIAPGTRQGDLCTDSNCSTPASGVVPHRCQDCVRSTATS